jgi:hypothetical protein
VNALPSHATPRIQITLCLVVLLFARNALSFALADNLLAEPLGVKALLQLFEVADYVLAAPDDGILGGDGAVGGDAQLEGREQRMGDLVGGEDDVVVLEETLRKEVAERVVLLVKGEDGRVGDAWVRGISMKRGGGVG